MVITEMVDVQFGDEEEFKKCIDKRTHEIINPGMVDISNTSNDVYKFTMADVKAIPYHFVMKYATILGHTKGDSDKAMRQRMVGLTLYQELSTDLKENEMLQLIEVDKELQPLIEMTENEFFYRPLFFPKVFINTDLELGNYMVKGILVIDENAKANQRSLIHLKEDWMLIAIALHKVSFQELIIFVELCDDKVSGIKYDDPDTVAILREIADKMRNFACNLVDMVEGNEEDLEIVTIRTTREQNIKRMQRGKIQMPTKLYIKPKDQFRQYVRDYNTGVARGKITHKFPVAGHYMHFRSERYTPKVRGTSRWVKPYIRGNGILVSKSRVLKG